MKNRKRTVVNAATLAKHCNLSPRRIRQLVEIGMPKIGRDKFDFIESAGFYIRFLQNALEKKGAPVADGSYNIFKEQKSRSLIASVELKELELEQKRSSLVTRTDADKTMGEFVRMTWARFSTLPGRLAIELLGETSRTMAQAKIERAIREALFLLATSDAAECSANFYQEP
jgi:hypothetical protein